MKKQKKYNTQDSLLSNVKDEPRTEDKREMPDQTHMRVGSGGLLGSSVNSANTHYVKLKKGQRVPLLFTSIQKLLAHYNSMSKEELSVFELKLRPTPEESPLPFPDKPLEQ